MIENAKPFIPAWIDDLGLSAAEFRVFAHLCRSADNKTGVAWPSYRRMIEITGLSKNTVRRSIETLENPRKLISKIGKPFAGSCRYRVFPIVPPESRLEDSNSPTTGTIEALPIVPPVTHNSPSHGTSIVPPEGQEGSPKKVIQRRKSNIEISSDGLIFADWFKSTLPANTNLGPNWRNSFAETFDELVRLDKRDPEEIRRVSAWARSDSFWQSAFMSPAKLRKRNKDGIQTFDFLVAKMKTSTTTGTTNGKTLNLGRRGHSNSYNESTSLDHL
jgi:hypothetical protein